MARLRDDRGYTLTEMLTILGILSLFLLISIPNVVRIFQMNKLRSEARGLAAFLKVGRMKAVVNNRSYVSELDSTLSAQCASTASAAHVLVLYEPVTSGTAKVEDCLKVQRGVTITPLSTGSNNKKVTFKSNGMATTTAPNQFLVRSLNGLRCQIVCVNAAGAVQSNDAVEGSQCGASPYGATTASPCAPL